LSRRLNAYDFPAVIAEAMDIITPSPVSLVRQKGDGSLALLATWAKKPQDFCCHGLDWFRRMRNFGPPLAFFLS
jgi:hypothetical protein